MFPVDINQVREEADRIISLGPDEGDFEYGEECFGGSHSAKCQNMYFGTWTCITEKAQEASHHKKKLTLLHLLRDCARNPSSANGLKTLYGMAQKSSILDLK
jgi:hypothetical protein